MAVPTTRQQFVDTCLRRLGAGVIEIEMSPEQIDDRIDYALQKFRDYHFDGSQEVFAKHQITQTDIDNGFIPMGGVVTGTVMGVVEIFDLVSTLMGSGMFNIQYQFVLAALPMWSNMDLSNYFIIMQQLSLLQQVLVGKVPIRWNRYENNLYIDMSWDRVSPGEFLIIRCYVSMDPSVYPAMWADAWLQQYATAQLKHQWGDNLKKYPGVPLIGGVTFNGQKIYDEAEEEIERLEARLINDYSMPVVDMIN